MHQPSSDKVMNPQILMRTSLSIDKPLNEVKTVQGRVVWLAL